MISDKNLKLTFHIAPILLIIFGIGSISLYYFNIIEFKIGLITRDIIAIMFGFIILVMLIKSDLFKYHWKNGTVLFNFFFLLFLYLIISQIIKTIFEPNIKNLFPTIIIIVLAGIFFNTIKKITGTYLLLHKKSANIIMEKIEDLLKSKKIKYEKKGPQKASINNLMSFDERIYLRKYEIMINISSRGIIIGKTNSRNEQKINWLLRSINRKVEQLSK